MTFKINLIEVTGNNCFEAVSKICSLAQSLQGSAVKNTSSDLKHIYHSNISNSMKVVVGVVFCSKNDNRIWTRQFLSFFSSFLDLSQDKFSDIYVHGPNDSYFNDS